MSTRIHHTLQALLNRWTSAPTLTKLITIAALATSSLFTARFIENYRKWKALGKGGMPHDLRGYTFHLLAQAFLVVKEETNDIKVYDDLPRFVPGWENAPPEEQKRARSSFLPSSLPTRQGPASRAMIYVAPQREKNLNEPRDAHVEEAYLAEFDKLGDINSSVVEWKTSVLEKQGKAMFVRPEVQMPRLVTKSVREINHIHESDLSAHVFLSMSDSKEVVAKGWGERHRLSGTRMLSLSYMILYAPRTLEEVEVMSKIIQAGVDYCTYK